MKKLIFILVVGMLAGCGDSNYVEPTIEPTKLTPVNAGGVQQPYSSNFIPYK